MCLRVRGGSHCHLATFLLQRPCPGLGTSCPSTMPQGPEWKPPQQPLIPAGRRLAAYLCSIPPCTERDSGNPRPHSCQTCWPAQAAAPVLSPIRPCLSPHLPTLPRQDPGEGRGPHLALPRLRMIMPVRLFHMAGRVSLKTGCKLLGSTARSVHWGDFRRTQRRLGGTVLAANL